MQADARSHGETLYPQSEVARCCIQRPPLLVRLANARGARVTIGDGVEFGAATSGGAHIYVQSGGYAEIAGNIYISGGAYAFGLTVASSMPAYSGMATILPIESEHAAVLGAAMGKPLADVFVNGAFESAAVGDGSDVKKGLDPSVFPVS